MARRSFIASSAIALFLGFFSFLGTSAYAAPVNGTFVLRSQSNDYMSAEDLIASDGLVAERSAWRDVDRTNWFASGHTETNGFEASTVYSFIFRTAKDFHPHAGTNVSVGVSHFWITNHFIPYSNTLTVTVSGLPIGSTQGVWTLVAYPDMFTNTTEYDTGTIRTNSGTLASVPTGTYTISFVNIAGYAQPVQTNITFEAGRLVWSTNTYAAYSNDLDVTVLGYPAGNAEWSMDVPAAFTNSLSYKATFTNDETITGVPTGTYKFNFPGVVGYITPTNTTILTNGSPSPSSITGTYVLAYPTNVPAGQGIQKFFQPCYFLTNVYLQDSGVALYLRITALVPTNDPIFLQALTNGTGWEASNTWSITRVGDHQFKLSYDTNDFVDVGITNSVEAASPTNYFSTVGRQLFGCVTNMPGIQVTFSEGITNNSYVTGKTNLFITFGTNYASATDPFQRFTGTVTPDAGGTCTITEANGSLVQMDVSTNITIAFDDSGYSTNGVNRVGVELLALTNSVAFDVKTITNAVAPTISTNNWTSLFFRKVGTNTWDGRD